MKYLIVIGDGMADRPLKEIGGKTLLEACRTPNLDRIAREGCGGLVKTIPDSCDPGSDVANLSILGYDPEHYYTGRAPLEAVSMGRDLGPSDIAFRCNLVTVTENRLIDYCAGHISTPDAKAVVDYLQAKMGDALVEFVPGVSYRHLLLYRNAPEAWRTRRLKTTPPHDFTGKEFPPYYPKGEQAEIVVDLMARSRAILSNAPENIRRTACGLAPANMIWLWGQGGSVQLPSIPSRWGLHGAVISAVDLVRGIGLCAGLEVIRVAGATGYIDTNYAGKVEAALHVLRGSDFVYLHIEAPDEAGHSGKWEVKKQAIEDFDAKVVGPLLAGLEQSGEPFRMLIMPDHATPIELKTHSREPVPFVLYPSLGTPDGMQRFTEIEATRGTYRIEAGHELFRLLVEGA